MPLMMGCFVVAMVSHQLDLMCFEAKSKGFDLDYGCCWATFQGLYFVAMDFECNYLEMLVGSGLAQVHRLGELSFGSRNSTIAPGFGC